MSFATCSGERAGAAEGAAPPFPSISFTFAAIRSMSSADSSVIPFSFSISRIIATLFRCRSAVHAVARKTSTIRFAVASSTCPAPRARRLASLCSRAFRASASVLQVAARTPGTLFAAIAEPIPAPSTTMPKSASPSATRSAAAAGEHGVVDRVLPARPEVGDLVPGGPEVLLQPLLEFESAVIGGEGDPEPRHGTGILSAARPGARPGADQEGEAETETPPGAGPGGAGFRSVPASRRLRPWTSRPCRRRPWRP